MNTYRAYLTKAVGVLLFFGTWQLFATLSNTRMLPGLEAVSAELLHLVVSGELLAHAGHTLSKGFTGLGLALLAGSVLGVWCARNRYVEAALHPLISVLYPVPKLALYPVIILIFGFGAWSKIVQVGLECFFPIFVQMYAGTRALPRNMLWLAANNEATGLRLVRDVLLPFLLPYLLTGLRVATPIMLIVMCVTEFIGESQGLGHLIARYSSYFDTASAFAVIVVLGLFGLLADRLIVWIRTHAVYWERGVSL
jgi:ABC-type nitrate/sulfonate/bicarbonate transport system permease component